MKDFLGFPGPREERCQRGWKSKLTQRKIADDTGRKKSLWEMDQNVIRPSMPKVPTCSVTSRIHFDVELACRHSEVRPVVRGSGRSSTFTSRCQWQRAVSLFLSARHLAHVYTTEKKRRRTRGWSREKKSVPKENHAQKQNSCNPKVTVTDKSSEEGLRWPVSNTGGSRNLAVFEQLKGEFVDDGTNHSVKATCISFRNRAFSTGSLWRHQATSPSNSNRRKSTAGDLPAPPWTAVLLDDDHTLCGRQKKKLPSLSQTKWRSWENLSNRFSSFLGVHQMILATSKSVNNASCRGMWEQQSKPSDLGCTGLHPDLGAARLSLDLPDPARILVLDCLFMTCLRKALGVQSNHHDDERREGLHWSDRANLQAALKCPPAFDEGQQIPSQHVTVEARLGPERWTHRQWNARTTKFWGTEVSSHNSITNLHKKWTAMKFRADFSPTMPDISDSCLRFGTLPPKFIVRLPTVTVPLIVNPGSADVCAFELETGDSEDGGIGIVLADWSRYVESCFCSSLFGLT